MINIVIPMAGRGSRFQKAGYNLPKPLIPIYSKPMIQAVIENLRPNCEHKFIFICQREHLGKFSLGEKLTEIIPNCCIIPLDNVTEGAACTVLKAAHLIDNQDALMIANCDQWIDFDINKYIDFQVKNNLDGLIMTMRADDPKWSFVKLGEDNNVTGVFEKEVVSNEATVGIYNYLHGADFVWAAKRMIENNLRVNNEYYVAPAYNQLIQVGKKIGIYNIGAVLDGMYGLGTPDDLEKFLSLKISRDIIRE